MMYMPDAIRAMIELMEAEPSRLIHRNAYNLGAVDFTPAELAEAIKKRIPAFHIEYAVDPRREAIADSWPQSIDDSAAREEWKWAPRYRLDAMVDDMLQKLR
jgi:nucleoside-diphosphate-sugar epimerase